MPLADPSEAVLAGSPAFLNAVLPPLAAALGVRPRVADAPHQVFALCQERARLLVFEYRGQEWLPLAEDLKNTFGDELWILVAVPAELAGATGPLLGAGVDEVVRWDGPPEPLVAAMRRLVGLPPGAPPVPPRPTAARPPAPGPALTPVLPMPAVTPARPAPAVALSSPALTPARPVLTAVRPVPAATPVRPAAAVAPPAPPAPAPALPIVAAGGAALAPAPGLFADLAEDEPGFSIVEAPPDAQARWGDAELVAFERSSTWPGTVLASRDAEGLLAGALAGFWPEVGDLKGHTERIVADLSPLERDAIAGRPVPADPAPVCRAAALRWQVSAALASAPTPGSPVDSAAVRAILAEIDAVLAELKRVSQGSPPDSVPAVDRLRRDLVAEAVDLTEAVHRIAPPEAPSPGEAVPAWRGVAGTRVLSVRAGEAGAGLGEERRPLGPWVVLALAIAGAGAYHGHGYLKRQQAPPAAALPGAPAGMTALPEMPGGVRVLVSTPGAASRDEIDGFKAQQELAGRQVFEPAPGQVFVVPADPRAGAPAPAPSKAR
ncbi:MAG TPA: hypothetical protein VIV59_10665 [Anaeromyxobacteraceae bacterium]